MRLAALEKEFILRIKAGSGAEDIDGTVIQLMHEPEMQIMLIARYVCITTVEAYYHIRVTQPVLRALKERIDQTVGWEVFDLFELGDW